MSDSLLDSRRGGSGRKAAAAAAGPAAQGWDPTLCGTAALALAGLLAAAAWFATGAFMAAPPPASCVRYVPNSCLFQSDPSRPLKKPPCAPIPCSFGEEELECPFAGNGSFVHERKQDAAEECADPFMEGVRRPLLPPCSSACCEGDLPGSFTPDRASRLPGAQQWQPRLAGGKAGGRPAAANGTACSYFHYSGAEVLHHLQSNRVRVFVVGDSMQKQLHARLVHMFRGALRPVDHRIFTMARYALCRSADSYAIAPGSYDKVVKGRMPGPTLKILPDFFGAPPRVPGCDARKDPPVIIDSMFSASYAWQLQHLAAYLETLEPDERLVLVIGVNYMDRANQVSPKWLEFLDSIRQRVKIVVMSTPVGLVKSPEQVKRLQGRNQALRRWAQRSDGGVGFVDFDAMSHDMHRPPPCFHNIHFMCWADWAGRSAGNAKQPVPGPDENVLREDQFGVPVSSIYTTEDGQCHDEMNRNLWQIIFGIVMKHEFQPS